MPKDKVITPEKRLEMHHKVMKLIDSMVELNNKIENYNTQLDTEEETK